MNDFNKTQKEITILRYIYNRTLYTKFVIYLLNYLSWDYVQIEMKKNKVKYQRQIVITCVESAQGMDGIAIMQIHVRNNIIFSHIHIKIHL